MEYLQYEIMVHYQDKDGKVLNLIINGIPSIQKVMNLVNLGMSRF